MHRDIDYDDPNIASVIDELSFWSSRFGSLLFDHLQLRANLRVLDLGCGAGVPLFELAHVQGRTCQFVGVDSWRQAIERARLKLQTYGLANVQADGAASTA